MITPYVRFLLVKKMFLIFSHVVAHVNSSFLFYPPISGLKKGILQKKNETIFPLVFGFGLQLTLFSSITNRFPWREKFIFCPQHNRNYNRCRRPTSPVWKSSCWLYFSKVKLRCRGSCQSLFPHYQSHHFYFFFWGK